MSLVDLLVELDRCARREHPGRQGCRAGWAENGPPSTIAAGTPSVSQPARASSPTAIAASLIPIPRTSGVCASLAIRWARPASTSSNPVSRARLPMRPSREAAVTWTSAPARTIGRSRSGRACLAALEELPLPGRERLLARLATTSSLRDRQLTADDREDEPILVFNRENRRTCHV